MPEWERSRDGREGRRAVLLPNALLSLRFSKGPPVHSRSCSTVSSVGNRLGSQWEYTPLKNFLPNCLTTAGPNPAIAGVPAKPRPMISGDWQGSEGKRGVITTVDQGSGHELSGIQGQEPTGPFLWGLEFSVDLCPSAQIRERPVGGARDRPTGLGPAQGSPLEGMERLLGHLA